MGWNRNEGKFNDNTTLIDANLFGDPRSLGCYFIKGDEKCVLIDASGKDYVHTLIEKLDKMKLKPDILLLTHAHWDHANGTDKIREKFNNIEVMAGENAINSLENSSIFNKPFLDATSGVNSIKNVIPVKNGETLDLGGISLKIFSTPGHSDCSISVLDKKNGVLFVGDSFGNTVTDNFRMGPIMPPEFSEEKFLESIEKMKSVKFTSVGLAHFGVLTENLAENFLQVSETKYFEWKDILLKAWDENPTDENLTLKIKNYLLESGLHPQGADFMSKREGKWIIEAFKNSILK